MNNADTPISANSTSAHGTTPAVLHVISGLTIGGAEMMLVKLLQAGNTGRREAVLSLSAGGPLAGDVKAAGAQLFEVSMPGGFPPPGFAGRFRAVVREFKPDVVMAWMYRANAVCSALVPGGIPVIWNVRQSLDHNSSQRLLFRFTRRVNLWISGRPRMVIYNSRASHQQHLNLGFRAADQRVIPNGFDVERFQPLPEARRRLRREWGVADDEVLSGIVGRFHPIKNHLGFVRAAGLAVQQAAELHRVDAASPVPVSPLKLRFAMVGRGLDADNAELTNAVAAAGIEDRVILCGEQRNLSEIYSAFDIQVSSSLVEAFPNVLGEAMSCGLPCIATAVGDSAWVIGETGWMVPPDQPQELANAILRAAALPLSERRIMGEAARARITSEFEIRKVASHFHHVQQQALDGRCS